MSHFDIIMLHVNINMLHLDIIYIAWKGQKYATTEGQITVICYNCFCLPLPSNASFIVLIQEDKEVI